MIVLYLYYACILTDLDTIFFQPNKKKVKKKVKLSVIAISGICLGIFKGSHGSHRAVPEPIYLPTTRQVGHKHVT